MIKIKCAKVWSTAKLESHLLNLIKFWFWLLDASKEIIGEDGRVQKRIQIEEGTVSIFVNDFIY